MTTAVEQAQTLIRVRFMADPGTPRERARDVAKQRLDEFGPRLKAWRESREMSRRELGFFADLTEDSIRNYEEGRKFGGESKAVDPLGFAGLLRLALALGVTVEQLTTQDPQPGATRVERDPDAPVPAVPPVQEVAPPKRRGRM